MVLWTLRKNVILKNNFKNKTLKNYLAGSFRLLFAFLAFFIILLQFYTYKDMALAASGLKIYNYTTKKEYTYKDAQIKVTYNGKKVSVDSTPGILQNGIALVSYKDVFAKSAIKADCVYDKKAGTVSISKFGVTIVMKIGSTKAYINGKEVTAPAAPVKIKYVDKNVTKILVPSRFVSENLGFKYTWYSSTSTVAIELDKTPLYLSYNNGEPFFYKGTQGKVTIDGEVVNLGNMPSIITNNIAMLRAKRVFADSMIKADYKYNSKDKSITLSRNGNVLKMTVGSKTAYFNGNAIVLDAAPLIVTNCETGTSYVMIPGRITATGLGFNYEWDKTTATSVITSRNDSASKGKNETVSDSITNNNAADTDKTDNSKGNTTDKSWDQGKIIYQWDTYKDIIGESSGVHTINNSSGSGEKGFIYSITKDYSKVYINSETYAIYGTKPFTKVTSSVNGKHIQVDISDLNATDNTYYMQNQNDGIVDTIHTYPVNVYNSRVEFNLTSDKFSYDLSLSSDKNILYVTIYYNFLNKMVIGSNNTMDYISLTGMYPLNVEINRVYNVITIDLPGTKKGFDDKFTGLTGTLSLYNISLFYTSDGTHMVLNLNDVIDYYVVEDGNTYTIMLPSNGRNYTPVDSNGSDTSSEIPLPEYTDLDINQYELVIPKPAGLTLNQITDEDQYYNLSFSIRLPGDYVAYLKNNPVKVNSSVIKNVSVFLNSRNETEIQVKTSKIQGYRLYMDQNYICVKVGDPKTIYKNIVVLDPGHGGASPGALYNKTYEKTINFKILYEIGKNLFNLNPYELKVYYTRVTDKDVSLSDRAAFAKKVGADLFVSLHMNACTSSSVYGTEVYYSTSNNKKNASGLNSETLAKLFINNICNSLNTYNRGVRTAKYTVIHKNTVPAILIELGYMSNKSEFTKLTDYDFQWRAAKTIYETLLQVFELYPTGR